VAELTAEGQAKLIANYEHLLHLLANTYEHCKKLDDSEDGALGGVGMVAEEIVPDLSATALLILALAARQIATLRKANYDPQRRRP
jgi:hypothetical protein